MISMTRSALSRKITIGAASSLAAAVLAVGGATAAHATTRPTNHGTTAAVKTYRPATLINGAQPAVSAQPASDIQDCVDADPNDTDICWWVDANQVGKMHPVRDAIENWTTQKESTCSSGTWNDCASTLYNDNLISSSLVFSDADWDGGVVCLPPDGYLGNLADYAYPNTGENMNDTISSNSWAEEC
jgi:hypothetical protein